MSFTTGLLIGAFLAAPAAGLLGWWLGAESANAAQPWNME